MKLLHTLSLLAGIPLMLAAAPAPNTTPTGTAPATASRPATRAAVPPPALPTTHPAGSPIADGATLVKLADGFAFTEGSTSDKNGDIYFIDQPNDRIMKWEFDRNSDDPMKGKLSVFLHPSGYSNGMSFDNDGNLIDCADEKNALWRIAAPFPPLPAGKASFEPSDLKITVLIRDFDPVEKKLNPETGGKPLNGPNDVWVIPAGPQKGGLYITDPLYARTWWTSRPGGSGVQQAGKFVYFLSPDGKTLTPVITDFVGRAGANGTPNGIIGTPDGKTLYVSNIDAGQTFSYTINADGSLSDRKLFCSTGSDGMTIDSDGNVYTTGGRNGLQIFNRNGERVDQINVGCANCCFGGKDGNVLFICNSTAVYGVKMKTHRVGPQ